MRIAYFNCSNGIAGDMILSSFINSGINPKILEQKIKKNLKIYDWKFKISENKVFHFPVTMLDVSGRRNFMSCEEIRNILRKSSFKEKIKKASLNILDRLIKAESKVHKVPLRGVHFHELNSIDTLVDITGACVCLDMLQIDKVFASAVNIGSYAPASAEIFRERNAPIFSSDSSFELATPTGAAIISEITEVFGDLPELKIEKYGFGSGTKKVANGFSVLKLIIGKTEQDISYQSDEVVMLETNIDDMDPRIYPYVMEKLFLSGAKDVWFTQVLMKKGRPGIVLSALCSKDAENKLLDVLFKETTTLGVRRFFVPRYVLDRKIKGDKKLAFIGKGKMKAKSEFEIAKKKALETGEALGDLLS